MPLSGLDPSMLLGFLCKDESDWKDFRRRVAEVSPRFACDSSFKVWELMVILWV
jgi:hypothetical protein